MKKFMVMILLVSQHLVSKEVIQNGENALDTFKKAGLVKNEGPIRLHLGCGEGYLKGYINIDYPSSDHTVQERAVADIFGDITKLVFPSQSIDEFRSHHTFEHFNRQTALALLCAWHNALKIGGQLLIETPDFLKSIQMVVDPSFNYMQKQIIIRHIFGSHEAFWAYHYDGWYKDKFEYVLNALGFEINRIEYTQYKLIHNIIIHATKKEHLSYSELIQRATNQLRVYMVDDSSCENKMHKVWVQEFEEKLSIMLQ